MAIKRYLPRYRKLLRFSRPLWFEKRIKLRKFEKQKWQGVKKFYYPKKLRFFCQDVSSYSVAHYLNVDRPLRLKKTYRFLLRDKQRLQYYYSGRRFRFFQLKNLARKLRTKKISKGFPHSKVLFFLLENRLDTLLYRFSIVYTIPQARKLIQTGRIKVNDEIVTNPSYGVKAKDILSLDPFFKDWFVGTYMKKTLPYFFYGFKPKRRKIVGKKKESWEQSFPDRNLKKTYLKVKKFILNLNKKNGSLVRN